MKIINAAWEKRNLGVNCVELNVGNNDSLTEFNDAISKLQSEYQVVRIPSGKTDMLLSAQKAGFQVIEMNMQLDKMIKDYKLPSIYTSFEPYINVLAADASDIDTVLGKIKKGDLFVTDKVARDPFFSTGQSGNRYYNWSMDVLDQGAKLYRVQYKDADVGFVLNYTKDGKLYDAFLGGVFPEYANKGLGFLVVHANIISIMSRGGNRVITGVSSNNMPILRLYLLFGFDIWEMRYILIKHL